MNFSKKSGFGVFLVHPTVRCYYPHWSRDALSPVCGIFQNFLFHQSFFFRTMFFFIKQKFHHIFCHLQKNLSQNFLLSLLSLWSLLFLHIIKSYSCTLVKVTFLPSSYDRLTNNNTSRAAQDSYIYFVLFLDLSSLNFHQISPLSQFDLVVAMSVCLSV